MYMFANHRVEFCISTSQARIDSCNVAFKHVIDFFFLIIEVSAPRYVELLMDWIEGQLDNESIFPQKRGNIH